MKYLLLISIFFIAVNIQAQNEELFHVEEFGEKRFSLTPKGETNPFINKKLAAYMPASNWVTDGVNRILTCHFTEEQIEKITNAKIAFTIYGDWSGEIKYVEFKIHKHGLTEVSMQELYLIYENLKKLKAPKDEFLSYYKEQGDYFMLSAACRLRAETTKTEKEP